MTSTAARGTTAPLAAYITWLVVLSAVAYVIESTNADGYCNFPEYLWRPLPDGGERKWLNRAIYKGNSETWIRRREISVLRKRIIVSLVSREPCGGESVNSTASSAVCYKTEVLFTYQCLAEEATDKFRVVIQRDKKDEFTCLKLKRRDAHVVQLWAARKNEVNEDSLCHEEALKRDPWPWIITTTPNNDYICRIEYEIRIHEINAGAEAALISGEGGSKLDGWLIDALLDEWQPMPLMGGFDFGAHIEGRKTKLCRKQWRPSRIESDCVLGDGVRFFFPDKRCSIFENVVLEQRLHCWGSWEEDDFRFVILSQSSQKPQYTLRLPKVTDGRKELVGTIYYSPLCPLRGSGKPSSDVYYVQLHMRRSDNGACYDESERCVQFARQGRCTNSALYKYANHCKKSCGLCGRFSHLVPSVRAECHFPADYLGHWILYDSKRSEHVTIGEGQVTFSLLGNFICKSKHWDKNHYKLLSVYQNGCRPRYTCAHFRRDSNRVLLFRLSKSSIIDRSFELCRFEDDATPLGSRVSSRTLKVLLPQEKTRFDSCGLDGAVNVHVTLGDNHPRRASLSDLSPASGCQPRPELSLSVDSRSDTETLVWRCAAYVELQPGRNVLITATEKYNKPTNQCWLVFTDKKDRWRKAYLLSRSQCGITKDFDSVMETLENVVLSLNVVSYTTSCDDRKLQDTTTTPTPAAGTRAQDTTPRRVTTTTRVTTWSDIVIMTIDNHDKYQRRSGGSRPNSPQLTIPGGACPCSPTRLALLLTLCVVTLLSS